VSLKYSTQAFEMLETIIGFKLIKGAVLLPVYVNNKGHSILRLTPELEVQ
jgi:hypothetical protein